MSPPSLSPPPVTPEMLMQVFEPPISFHRCLVPVASGVAGALLLSEAIWSSQELPPAYEGWFTKTQDEWQRATGLSRWEQETARRLLREAGLLEERRLGLPAKLWFRVRADRVWQALRAADTCTPGHGQGRM